MCHKNRLNLKAFTFIEIVVVLTIVGISATIGVPIIYTYIQRSKAAEASSTFEILKPFVESCVKSFNGLNDTSCDVLAKVVDPTTTLSSPNFTYNWCPSPPGYPLPSISGVQTWAIRATLIGGGAKDYIEWIRDVNSNVKCYVGSGGVFSGVCESE